MSLIVCDYSATWGAHPISSILRLCAAAFKMLHSWNSDHLAYDQRNPSNIPKKVPLPISGNCYRSLPWCCVPIIICYLEHFTVIISHLFCVRTWAGTPAGCAMCAVNHSNRSCTTGPTPKHARRHFSLRTAAAVGDAAGAGADVGFVPKTARWWNAAVCILFQELSV